MFGILTWLSDEGALEVDTGGAKVPKKRGAKKAKKVVDKRELCW